MLSIEQMYTLTFLMLVCVAQANVYLIREKRAFWQSRPGKWMLLATGFDMSLVTLMALKGVLMEPLSLTLILALYAATLMFMFGLDVVKVQAFRFLGMIS